jgi:hypothetical protein
VGLRNYKLKLELNINEELYQLLSFLSKKEDKGLEDIALELLKNGLETKHQWSRVVANSVRGNMILLDIYNMLFDKEKSLYSNVDFDDGLEKINQLTDESY